MYKKLIVLFSLVSLLGLVNSALGQSAYAWTGNDLDGLWSSPGNWDPPGPPLYNSLDVYLSDQTNGSLITIPVGYDAACTFGGEYGTIFGPEFGMNLDIYGSLSYKWSLATFANDSNYPTVINMFDGSSIYHDEVGNGPEDIAIGNVWWDHTGPYVTMNMYGSASVDVNWLWIGGHLNMYGESTMDIETGVAMEGSDDALMLMDLYDGAEMILPDAFTDTVNDWISRGILVAYGGTGEIVIDTEVNPGRTTVTAIPEPSTMALLCLGGLALIRRKRS